MIPQHSSRTADAALAGRIRAGRASGASLLDIALTKEVDPAPRRVLCEAGIEPGS